MTFNITAKRLEALRFIGQRPGVLVGCVADNVLARTREDGSVRSMWSQAATRSGAGYCKQLASAGLVRIDTFQVRSGYGRVSLTAAGQAVLDEADAAANASRRSLDAVLARCESAA